MFCYENQYSANLRSTTRSTSTDSRTRVQRHIRLHMQGFGRPTKCSCGLWKSQSNRQQRIAESEETLALAKHRDVVAHGIVCSRPNKAITQCDISPSGQFHHKNARVLGSGKRCVESRSQPKSQELEKVVQDVIRVIQAPCLRLQCISRLA